MRWGCRRRRLVSGTGSCGRAGRRVRCRDRSRGGDRAGVGRSLPQAIPRRATLPLMGLLGRLFGKDEPQRPVRAANSQVPRTRFTVEVSREDTAHEPRESWYVPVDGDNQRFVHPAGGPPPLHLISYKSGGEQVLRLCEDSTGLLIGPTDRRLPHAGIFVGNLRGAKYHEAACTAGDFRPGVPVRLVAEPDNPHDPNAVAVYAADGSDVAAYYNKQKARTVSRLLLSGETLHGVSLRGTGPGEPLEALSVLAARPEVIEHLLSTRPPNLPPPAHLGPA